MTYLEELAEHQQKVYYRLFLEAINSLPKLDHRDVRKFTIRGDMIDNHDGEGLEGWEDLTHHSNNLVNYVLSKLQDSGLYLFNLTDSENWILFLEYAFGYQDIDFLDYKKDLINYDYS